MRCHTCRLYKTSYCSTTPTCSPVSYQRSWSCRWRLLGRPENGWQSKQVCFCSLMCRNLCLPLWICTRLVIAALLDFPCLPAGCFGAPDGAIGAQELLAGRASKQMLLWLGKARRLCIAGEDAQPCPIRYFRATGCAARDDHEMGGRLDIECIFMQ
jgi:hypothetical protein